MKCAVDGGQQDRDRLSVWSSHVSAAVHTHSIARLRAD